MGCVEILFCIKMSNIDWDSTFSGAFDDPYIKRKVCTQIGFTRQFLRFKNTKNTKNTKLQNICRSWSRAGCCWALVCSRGLSSPPSSTTPTTTTESETCCAASFCFCYCCSRLTLCLTELNNTEAKALSVDQLSLKQGRQSWNNEVKTSEDVLSFIF